jgi:hypothetical protein
MKTGVAAEFCPDLACIRAAGAYDGWFKGPLMRSLESWT